MCCGQIKCLGGLVVETWCVYLFFGGGVWLVFGGQGARLGVGFRLLSLFVLALLWQIELSELVVAKLAIGQRSASNSQQTNSEHSCTIVDPASNEEECKPLLPNTLKQNQFTTP